MTPVYMSILVNKGIDETRHFFTRMFSYFLLVMIPVVFGAIATGKQIISVLASKKYEDAYEVLVYVLIGQAVYACTIILNSGLFISKKTYIVNRVMLFTCLINIVLNFFLIRVNGIVGAAQATLVSYIVYAVIITVYAFREFSFRIEVRPIISYLVASLLMFLVITRIQMSNSVVNLIVQIIGGIGLYATVAMLLESRLRDSVKLFVFQKRVV